jgi:FMN-dependent dehydrogenase
MVRFGGHLIRFHDEIDQAYPGCLELDDLHAHPTVAELAKYLHRAAAPALASPGDRMRTLDRYQAVDDFEESARRVLPRHGFDYMASGSFSEITSRRNLEAFDRYSLLPRALEDVTQCRLSTPFLGRNHSLPLMLAPTTRSSIAELNASLPVNVR